LFFCKTSEDSLFFIENSLFFIERLELLIESSLFVVCGLLFRDERLELLIESSLVFVEDSLFFNEDSLFRHEQLEEVFQVDLSVFLIRGVGDSEDVPYATSATCYVHK
jgi:hypothetical protein